MKKDNPKYLNFPISLLQGFIKEPKKALNNIIAFCIVYEVIVHQKPFGEVILDFNMACPDDEEAYLQFATSVFEKTPRNQPRTGMEVGVFWEFMKEEKTDEEKATLLAFLAIKSILGFKEWYKLGKQEIIFHRMAGQTDTKRELPGSIKKHCTRHKFDKIKIALQDHWGIVIYSRHTRGIYLSTRLCIEELALVAEKRKLATGGRHAALKAQQDAARDQALKVIGASSEKQHL